MKFVARWIDHNPDTTRDGRVMCGKVPPRTPSEVIFKEAHECECFLGVRHTHCSGCGRIITKGDWDAKPIREFFLCFSGEGVR